MKSLRNLLDKLKPNFEKGGKLGKFHATFDAFETFLFVPNKVTLKGAHIRDSIDLKRTMTMVIIALIPTILFGMWNVGYQHYLSLGLDTANVFKLFSFGFIKVFPIIVVTYISGLAVEFIFAEFRGHEVNEGILVTGMLIPMIVPVETPLWMISVATIFAILIGKETFGGTGMNIFNPALLARAFLFFAYPQDMSGEKVWIAEKADAYSGATPLAHLASGDLSSLPSTADMFWGTIPGSIGETSTFAILLGAAFLLYVGIANWRIMLSVFLGGYAMGLLFQVIGGNPAMTLPAYQHLLLGGFAFGAVFMATDPVTASQTNTGKYIYGFLIGALAIVIRVLNPAYPEGMMLSILLMNTFAPLIDFYVVEANIKRRLNRIKNR